ncbi:HNH endonuclease [Bacillus ginsengihumi]|uniref:Putative HNH nuclease YajD n=1 Tax=Heyndrickxia ginsengihumi TaxID=363870 RepID=A0A6M0P7H9_9BACI|nr:HNH endonuclease signature motif containing protein [Heyndrickxia ginsengihumi]NEY20511.1 HNH endonuclease [Heyndrickxia ginsengihumi]
MTISRERLRWLEGLIREDKMIPFYKWSGWRKKRQEALERDNYECQECKREGKYSRAQNVHHLKEVKDRPDLALTLDNLESVCIQCHNKIHDKRLKKDKRKPFVIEERW